MTDVPLPYRWLACTLTAISLLGCGTTDPDIAPPEVKITSPSTGAVVVDNRVSITVDAIDDRSVQEVDLSIDGQPYATDRDAPWEFEWPTAGVDEGDYVLHAEARDGAGNAASHDVTVHLRDAVLITEIQVQNMGDGVDNILEVEAHLYDADSDTFLGCSGATSGLRYVELSGNLYQVQAFFLKPPVGDEVLTYDEIAQRNVYVMVTEDDRDACPYPPSIGGGVNQDDLFGTSPPFPGQDLASSQTLGFGDVVRLVMARGRRD
jgi:hypothetical protein